MDGYGISVSSPKKATTYYVMAAILGVGIFSLLLLLYLAGAWLIPIILRYWLFLAIITVIIMIVRRYFKRKKVVYIAHPD